MQLENLWTSQCICSLAQAWQENEVVWGRETCVGSWALRSNGVYICLWAQRAMPGHWSHSATILAKGLKPSVREVLAHRPWLSPYLSAFAVFFYLQLGAPG